MDSYNEQQIRIQCQDGTELATTFYSSPQPIAGVMLAPATGIKRQFYTHFCRFLCQQGFSVLSFDNRGIGDSLEGHVKHSSASLQCWGEQDMPAALEELKRRVPNGPWHLIGHSAGGQLVGLMDNALELASMVAFASSSGSLRNMKLSYQPLAQYFMNLFIPVNNWLFGYTNSQWVGMGEPLPKRVANQWRQWCNGQGYVKTAFGKTVHRHQYDELQLPTLWINAIDDNIACDANATDMLSVMPKINAERVRLDPKQYGLKEIGHMKFFSRQCQQLWPMASDWLLKQSQIAAKAV
ncbi:alpha/beta hydrolase family protein [Ferrimonas aestuarii]|uniref:Alpha/beta fold hydrolase n=1 Tax=Ferrimonas aestuarii TaxID=2569539 RepID=A0A4U1BLI0_9GAMM|nr:alpha/beta fold hydrolase [Ferrimonas aestuarii]TKB51665.1 alpha/beta fold hydrolase [Ferrimonas aestuarii]